jgi:hypothetical protein
MVIPLNAEIRDIATLWRRILDMPESLELQCARHSEMECHRGFKEGSVTPLATYTIASDSNRPNATIYEGSETFKADQIGRLLVIKVPPFAQAKIEARANHVTLSFECEWITLGLRVLREHDLAFQLRGSLIEAPTITSWWYPYNYEAIMRYGHSLNSDIPGDPNEVEFPPEQWPQRVIIRIKESPPPNPAPSLCLAGDASAPHQF